MPQSPENAPPSPVEARLTKTPLAVTCELIDEQQHTSSLHVSSIHMHGAKQEVTAELRGRGYGPRGRWEPPNADSSYSARVFALEPKG
jgi:hypothetical protein